MSGDGAALGRKSLCHPDGKKSCGACCGMYNHVEAGSEAVKDRLRQRTLAYRRGAQISDEESLREFRREWEDGESVKLLTGLPACPFLGFIDLFDEEDQGQRVGCLVHPLQNDGVDGRDCGVFDRFICEDYLCAAHDVLRSRESQLVIDAVKDSYLYGLVITNPRFVRAALEIVADRSGGEPSERVLKNESVRQAAGQLFELLRDWPYRGRDGIFGQVQVSGPLDTRRRRFPAEVLSVEASEVDVLLVCMGTECGSVEELHQARGEVEKALGGLIAAVEAVSGERRSRSS